MFFTFVFDDNFNKAVRDNFDVNKAQAITFISILQAIMGDDRICKLLKRHSLPVQVKHLFTGT